MELQITGKNIQLAPEVRRYIEQNPDLAEERYLLKTTVIPFDKAPDEEALAGITEFNWIESGWINKSSLSDQMQFVAMMGVGTMGKPVKTQHGYQLVLLAEKEQARARSFEDRYREVEETLRLKKMETFEEEYQEELKKRAVVVYLLAP